MAPTTPQHAARDSAAYSHFIIAAARVSRRSENGSRARKCSEGPDYLQSEEKGQERFAKNSQKQQPRGNVRMDSAMDCGRCMQKLQRGRRRRAALYHLFCPLFNSPMCALKHRLHMPSLASRPAAKGCPAAHRFSISNKNRAPRRFCGASAAFVCTVYAGHHPLTHRIFCTGLAKKRGTKPAGV